MKKLLKSFLPALFMLITTACSDEELLVPASTPGFSPEEKNSQTLSSQRKLHHDGEKVDGYVVQSWYELMLKLIKETPGHTPPIAARSIGYTGVALYESLVGEMPHHHSLVGQLNGLNSIPERMYGNSYSAPLTANAALARIIKELFQNASLANMQRIDSLESAHENLYATRVSEIIMMRSRNYGRAVADAVFNWSLSDGGHEAYIKNFPSDYTAPQGEDKWIPTPPGFQPAMLPYWGSNRPMIAANAAGPVDPPAPVPFSAGSTSSFYQAAYEVYQTTMNLTAEQTTIALYWNDGVGSFTPPGHNMAIALQLIRNLHLNLNQAAILLAKIGIALNDASIVCWRSKYLFNLMRPVTFIQHYIDGSWATLITTPPFPSYTSGHSTFSGAVAGILTSELGSAVSFSDSSKMADGFSPRSFSSFNAYAQEAAVSRLYGGIHYSFDNENGLICGQRIALHVEQLMW